MISTGPDTYEMVFNGDIICCRFFDRAVHTVSDTLLSGAASFNISSHIEGFSQDNLKKGVLFVQTLMERGVLTKQDPEAVEGVIRAVLMLRLLKNKLGSDLFPKIMDLIMDYIAEGLTELRK